MAELALQINEGTARPLRRFIASGSRTAAELIALPGRTSRSYATTMEGYGDVQLGSQLSTSCAPACRRQPTTEVDVVPVIVKINALSAEELKKLTERIAKQKPEMVPLSKVHLNPANAR